MNLHCKFCGSNHLDQNKEKHLCCNICGKINFQNPVTAAGCFLIDELGNIGLAKRAHNPRKGKYDEAGGFCDLSDKSLEDTVIRELKEELGINIIKEQLQYLTSSYCEYPFDGYITHVMVSYFYAYVTKEQKLGILSNDDVESFTWFNSSNFNVSIMTSEFQANVVLQLLKKNIS